MSIHPSCIGAAALLLLVGCSHVSYERNPRVERSEADAQSVPSSEVMPVSAAEIADYEELGELTVRFKNKAGVTDEQVEEELRKEAGARGCTAFAIVGGETNTTVSSSEATYRYAVRSGPIYRKVRAACLRSKPGS